MAKNVRIIWLSSGERIIGTVLDDNDVPLKYYKVTDPYVLKEMMTEQGLSYIPVGLSNKENEVINVNKSCVVIEPYEPIKELKDMYNTLISNIVVPNLKIIQ